MQTNDGTSGPFEYFDQLCLSSFSILHKSKISCVKSDWFCSFSFFSFFKNAKSTSSPQEVGAVLKQLMIVPSEKPTPRGMKKDKMAAGSRRRKKARRR